VELIVRGACILPAGPAGFSDGVRVRSIIGRYLEHSRVFYFRAGADEHMYLSSADWMGRNMFRRIELAWPVHDPAQRQRLIDETLTAYLHEGRDAWVMDDHGKYRTVVDLRRRPGASAQHALVARYGGSADAGGAWT
jgi:polyphosphate kinase